MVWSVLKNIMYLQVGMCPGAKAVYLLPIAIVKYTGQPIHDG